MLWTIENLNEILKKLTGEVAYIDGYISTLGGEHRAMLFLIISLDPKNCWSNNILENSRYAKISIDHTGRMEFFSGSVKGRACTVNGTEEIIKKLEKWIEKNVDFK